MWIWITVIILYGIGFLFVMAICNAAKRGDSDLPSPVRARARGDVACGEPSGLREKAAVDPAPRRRHTDGAGEDEQKIPIGTLS